MDQICSLMDTTMRLKAGERGLPIGLPRSWDTHRWPRQNVCISSAVVSKDGTPLMRIFLVTFKRRNVRPLMRSPGGNFVVVQKHVPGTKELLLVDTGEEFSEVLVVHLEMTMSRSLSKDRQEVIDITSGKMIRNEFKNHANQDIEHGPEGCIHEGDDGPATLVVLLFLGQDIARWKLTALTNSPWIGLGVLTVQPGYKSRSDDIRSFVHLAKYIGIQKGAFDGLVVEARAEDSQG